MILPTTYLAALLLTFVTMVCWGSWANTTKMAGKWRFELYYFDYSFGLLLAATVLALTFGQFGTELTFQDNLLIARKRSIAFGLLAGGVFNLANMLLVAAISLTGMAVAFPVGIGLALVIGVVWSYSLNPQGNPMLLAAGALLLLGGVIVTAMAHKKYAAARDAQKAKEWAEQGKRKVPKKTGFKGVGLSLAAGLLMGSFYPLVEISKQGELGLRAYAVGFVFALGVFLTTPVYNLVFMNIPVKGKPVGLQAYFRGTARQHLLGVLGGIIWSIGAIANFAAASAPREVQVGPAISYAIGQGAVLVSTLWGLLYWKEFIGAGSKVKQLIAVMLVLLIVGIVLIALAPLFA
jgi:glucose uptake protein